MRIGLLTREYPPEVYGGAGVHVELPGAAAARARRRRRALLRRAARRTPARTTRRPGLDRGERRAADAVGRPGDGRRAGRARRSRTRTPGTPTWPGTWPSCSTASRTWSPRTRWSRAGRGRPSSSAAATGSRRGSSGPRTRRADAVIAVSEGMRADVLDCYPALDPARVHVVHNGIDTRLYHPDRRRATRWPPTGSTRTGRSWCSSGGSPGRRASGTWSPPRTEIDAGRADRAVRGRAGHPGDRRGDASRRWPSWRRPRPGVFWVRRDAASRAEVRQILSATRRCSSARRCTSRWAS